jgi:hypothetical protein
VVGGGTNADGAVEQDQPSVSQPWRGFGSLQYEAQAAVVTGRLRQVDQQAEHLALDQPAEKGPESTDGASVVTARADADDLARTS